MGNTVSSYTQTSLNCSSCCSPMMWFCCSYTPVGLQHQLNLLARNADSLDLIVNLEKSNIVVFRNGGYLARGEKWYYKDSVVKVVYGSKIWGMQMDLQIQKAHLFALKRLLNVSPKTPNDMVYGETGRTPLHMDAKVSSIRFWLRLMRMEAERLPRKAYNMLVSVYNNGRQCWVSAVHRNLMMYGSGYV